MSKLTVNNSISVSGRDINEWAEPAKTNDIRSNIKFDSSNKHLQIINSKYNKNYVTVYKSTGRSKELDIDKNNYQRNHCVYMGKLSGKHIWLSERGCRPQLNDLCGIQSTPGTYTFTLQGAQTKISSDCSLLAFNTTAKEITIDAKIFYLTFVAGGGNGHSGYAQVNNWAFLGLASSEWYTGCGGGSGASATLLIDMTKIPNNKFKLVIGGASSSSSLYVNDNILCVGLMGGGNGGKCKSGKNTNWDNASNSNKNSNDNAGSGGGYSCIDISGVTVLSIDRGAAGAGSKSVKVREQYSEANKQLTYTGKPGSKGYGNGGAGSIFGNGGNSPNNYDASAGNGGVGAGGGGGTVPDATLWWNASGSCSGGSGGNGAFKLYY